MSPKKPVCACGCGRRVGRLPNGWPKVYYSRKCAARGHSREIDRAIQAQRVSDPLRDDFDMRFS